MRKNAFLSLGIVGLMVFVAGCSEKIQEAVPSGLAPINETSLTQGVTLSPEVMPQLQNASVQTPQALGGQTISVQPAESVSGAGMFSAKEIQQALKNAGLYDGAIDGKIGPKSRKAIEEFQAKNGLKADGKVGPMTWEKLKAYLETAPEASSLDIKN